MFCAHYQISIYDAEQNLISKTAKIRSRSFVKQFLQVFWKTFTAQNISATDTTNTSRALLGAPWDTLYDLYCTGPGGNFNYYYAWANSATYATQYGEGQRGIQLGTSSQAVAMTDYALITPVVHGISAGQLEHFSCAAYNLTIDSGTDTGSFDLERLVRNSSGDSITVNELAVYGTGTRNQNGYVQPYQFCFLRDVVSPGFTIADGEYARIKYTFSITS